VGRIVTPEATAFAVLTPPGAAAVATVAVAGPRAWAVVRELFRPAAGTLPTDPAADHIWYGSFGHPPGDAVVLAVRTTRPVTCVELHCHGGTAVLRLIGDELARRGVTPATAERLTRAKAPDGLRSEALSALARAPTVRTASILLDQADGALCRAVAEIWAAADEGDRSSVAAFLEPLRRRAVLGPHLTQPWRVVVAGAPNVGKSSLVNALAGYQRAVVTPVPGTTRDAVVTPTAIDGWPVELVDTAGQHESADELEGQGIDRARAAAANADLCLWVVDRSAEPVWPSEPLPNALVVINKADLPAAWEGADVPDPVSVSAQTGAGIDALCDRLSRTLVPTPPEPGAAVPFTPDLADRIATAAEAAARGDLPAVCATLRSIDPSQPK
jgi:tRNA modification GTPase